MTAVAVSVVLISFGGTTEGNLAAARELGFRFVQLRNVGTDLTVEALTPKRRDDLRHHLRENGLALSSLSGGYGPLLESGKTADRIEAERRLTRLAGELGCRYVTGHIGSLRDVDFRRAPEFVRGMAAWIEEMERRDLVFAIESGSEHGETLRQIIDYFDSPSLRVNLDPANFLFYGFDPIASCEALYDVSVHFHCKDARRRPSAEASGKSSVPGFPDARHADEVRAGSGDVPFARILPELARRGVVQVAAVERESGLERRADVLAGKRLIERYFEVGKEKEHGN